jgi:selenophosphate synthetase-related protein
MPSTPDIPALPPIPAPPTTPAGNEADAAQEAADAMRRQAAQFGRRQTIVGGAFDQQPTQQLGAKSILGG